MDTQEIVWQDPPLTKHGRRSRIYASFVAALKARPDEWAVWKTDGWPSEASAVRRGQGAFTPAGAFEVTTRICPTDPRKCSIYVRYVGEPEPEAVA